MIETIQLRRGTAYTWSSINPVLHVGEMGIETDTLKFKIGDGSTAWNSLAYSAIKPQPTYPTPANENEIVACLRAAGLCACILFSFVISATGATPTPTATATATNTPTPTITPTATATFTPTPTPNGNFEYIPRTLNLGAGQAPRRNATNTAFEAWTTFTPTPTPSATATPTPTSTPTITPITAFAAGTVYSLTNSDALVHFGTTDPTIVIDKTGTYLLFGRAYVVYNGATYAANQTVTLHLRRTNNTPADIANATTTATLRVVTTLTDTVGVMPLPPVVYTTSNTTDSISVYGSLSSAPAAGSVDVKEASIVALKIL